MVRSIGIDPGDQMVKVVELDGSYKKTRLVRVHAAPAAAATADAAAHADAVAAAARAALDEGMKGEETLGHPCREAVLRVIELPFKGHDAIRKVVKAEIEGEIQSQSVDEMVVDFHEIGAGISGGTRVMVASVPKAGLRLQLAALAANKIEPESIDLDTMALWRAAHWAGAFTPEDDGAEGTPAKTVTAVVDLGARSVKVVLVEGEQLVEMRALRLGEAAVAEEIARRNGIDLQLARQAVAGCLTTGADQRLEVPVELPATADDEEPAAPPPPRQLVVHHDEVDTAHTAYLQRLSRELTRFLTASGRLGQLRAVWCTGGGSRTRGAQEMLAAVFGVEARQLDVLGRLQHDLPPEQATELQWSLATAVGLALGRLGGPSGFELRREDLVLTKGFERIKFPLAIACMVAWLTLFVFGNQKSVELRNLELQIGQTFIKDAKTPPAFYGMLYAVFSEGWFSDANHFRLEQTRGADYTFKDLVNDLLKTDVHKRVTLVRDKLRAVADQKQKESGIYEDVSLESGLAVLVRWAELMRSIEPQLKGMLVTRLEINMKSPNRRLDFRVAFRGEDFRDKWAIMQRALEADMEKPDSPFEKAKRAEAGNDEKPFVSEGNTVPGAFFDFSLRIKEAFEPFGAGGGRR